MIKWILAITLIASSAIADTNFLEGPTTVEFVDSGTPRSANLAVKPDLVMINSNDVPRLVEFSQGNVRFDSGAKPLSASWVQASNLVSGLQLTLNDSIRMPGSYEAILAPFPVSRPAERLSLQIIIPPAKLDVPSKLVVSRTVGLPGRATIVAPDLDVRETNPWTMVKNLEVTSIASFAGLAPISAHIQANPSCIRIEAGKSTTIGYNLDGDFPLGVVSGKLQFSATELADPITLDYEVQSRLSSLYIPIIIVSGFLLGYLVRVCLANVIAVGTAVEQGNDLLKQVNDSTRIHPDSLFLSQFEDAQKNLEQALNKRRKDAKEILRLVPLLEAAWRQALTDFAKREANVVSAYGELQNLTVPAQNIPGCVAPLFDELRLASVDAKKEIEQKNVSDAQSLIDAAKNTFAEKIQASAIGWQQDISLLCDGIVNSKMGLAAAVVSQFQEEVKSIGSLNQLKPSPVKTSLDDIRALLQTFQTEYLEIRALMAGLSQRLEGEWTQIQGEIRGRREKFNPAFDQLQKQYAEFRTDLENAVNDPKPFVDSLNNRLLQMQDSWRVGLLEQAPKDKQMGIESFLNARDFLGLAREVKLSLGDKVLGRESVQVVQRPAWPGVQKGSPAAISPFGRTIIVFAPLPPLRQGMTVQTARAWQGSIVAGLFVFVYWMLHADSFGQSWSEPAALLVLSFMTDLTTDGLLSALQKLKG